jgi:hypothetical protein
MKIFTKLSSALVGCMMLSTGLFAQTATKESVLGTEVANLFLVLFFINKMKSATVNLQVLQVFMRLAAQHLTLLHGRLLLLLLLKILLTGQLI